MKLHQLCEAESSYAAGFEINIGSESESVTLRKYYIQKYPKHVNLSWV